MGKKTAEAFASETSEKTEDYISETFDRFSSWTRFEKQGRNMVYGLRAQSPKYDWDQGSEEKAQGSEEWDLGSQGF